MSPTAADLLKAALQLPPGDRAELTDELYASLDPPESDTDGMTDEAFAAELDRRHAEYLRDPNAAIPWEEVKRKLLAE